MVVKARFLALAVLAVGASLGAAAAHAGAELLPDRIAGFAADGPAIDNGSGFFRAYTKGSVGMGVGLLGTQPGVGVSAARGFACSPAGLGPLGDLASAKVIDVAPGTLSAMFLAGSSTYLASLSTDDTSIDLSSEAVEVVADLRLQFGEPESLDDPPPDPALAGFFPSVSNLEALPVACAPPTFDEAELLAAGPAQQFIVRHSTEATQLYVSADGTEVCSVSITQYPYPEIAAVAAAVSPAGAPQESPAGLPADARAWGTPRAATQATSTVSLRRGRIAVLVIGSGVSDPSADVVALARATARLVPEGASSVESFPSATRTLGTSAGLLAGGALLLSSARVGVGLRQRRQLGGALRTLPPPNVTVVDRAARQLRRRGVVLLVVQWTCLVAGLTGSMLEIGWWRPVVLIGAVVVGMGLTAAARRTERSAEGAAMLAMAPRVVGLGAASLVVVASGAALLVRGLRDRFDRLSLSNLQLADRFTVAPQVLAALELLIGALLLIVGVVAVRGVRRQARRTVAQERVADPRPPVLYLRSFDDDDLPLPSLPSARRPFLDTLSLRLREPFEEAVAWQLEAYGPVIAVGRPGRSLGSLGAAREHLDDAVWQPQVAARMSEAAWIVVAIGATPGLGWELRRIVADGHLHKTILLTPPVPHAARVQRWQVTAGVLAAAGAQLATLDPSACLTVRLHAGPGPVGASEARWDEAAYRSAIAAIIGPTQPATAGPLPSHG